MRRAVILLWALCLGVACQLSVDASGGHFMCPDGRCPAGSRCVGGVCVSGDQPDAGPQADAGPPASCGNGVIDDPREQCDDGPGSPDTDGCLHTCRFSSCGDGFVRLGVESCDVAVDDSCPASCQPCAGMVFGGHCYEDHKLNCNYGCSQGTCFEGAGHIITITSPEENEVPALLLPERPRVWLWINEPTRFLTGEQVSFSAWAPGQPADLDPSLFGATIDVNTGKWTVEDRTVAVRDTVCELEGWFMSPRDNRAFKVEWQQKSFVEASNVCPALGGTLAVLDDTDRQVLAELLPDGFYHHTLMGGGCGLLQVVGHTVAPDGGLACTSTPARTLCQPATP